MAFLRVPALLAGALFVLVGTGCVIYTTEADSTPRTRQRRARSHRPPPPPPPRHARPPKAAQPAPSPQPAPLAVQPVMTSAQPAREEPPRTGGRPHQLPEGAGEGRPPGFRPGAPAAYWIWQGPRGGWRLRTTTGGATHVFRGHINGTSGPVSNVHPSRTEFRDHFWKTSEGTWAFSFSTSAHADGFTFVTRDNGCVHFDLQLDGGPEPKRVFVGKGEAQPPSGNFIVCPRAGRR